MSERVRVPEGEIVARKHDLLNTIVCKIEDPNRMSCETSGIPEKISYEFLNVFSVDGDIAVVGGGDAKIWVKPRPVGEKCALFVYERKEDEGVLGKDVKVVCGIKGQQMLEAYEQLYLMGVKIKPWQLEKWESMTTDEMSLELDRLADMKSRGT